MTSPGPQWLPSDGVRFRAGDKAVMYLVMATGDRIVLKRGRDETGYRILWTRTAPSGERDVWCTAPTNRETVHRWWDQLREELTSHDRCSPECEHRPRP